MLQGEAVVDEAAIEAGDETGRRLGNGSAETRGMGIGRSASGPFFSIGRGQFVKP